MKNISIIIFLVLLVFVSNSCKKLEFERIANIQIGEIIEIKSNSIIVSAQISDIGNGIINYGHCWDTNNIPTINNKRTIFSDIGEAKEYQSLLEDLKPATKYVVRAYLYDGKIVMYSNSIEIETARSNIPQLQLEIKSIKDKSIAYSCLLVDSNRTDLTARGICWSNSPKPTVSDNVHYHSEAEYKFDSIIKGLNRLSVYYIRAFCVSPDGIGYSDDICVSTTASLPTIKTQDITNITYSSAYSGGEIVDDGGAEILSMGICWDIYPDPSIKNFNNSVDLGNYNYNCELLNLKEITKYYVRAFARNSIGYSYGNQVVFRTESLNNIITDDRDGQSYEVIKIGEQWWMAENLNFFTDTASYYYNDDSITYASRYGRLYDWFRATDVNSTPITQEGFIQGVCPSGWHLPSSEEWQTLITLLGGTSSGGKMKVAGTDFWYSPNEGANNSSGFSALPAGYRSSGGDYRDIGKLTCFWTNQDVSEHKGAFIELNYDSEIVLVHTTGTKYYYHPIRCTKN